MLEVSGILVFEVKKKYIIYTFSNWEVKKDKNSQFKEPSENILSIDCKCLLLFLSWSIWIFILLFVLVYQMSFISYIMN